MDVCSYIMKIMQNIIHRVRKYQKFTCKLKEKTWCHYKFLTTIVKAQGPFMAFATCYLQKQSYIASCVRGVLVRLKIWRPFSFAMFLVSIIRVYFSFLPPGLVPLAYSSWYKLESVVNRNSLFCFYIFCSYQSLFLFGYLLLNFIPANSSELS